MRRNTTITSLLAATVTALAVAVPASAATTSQALPANTPFGHVSGSFIPGYQDAADHARETYGPIQRCRRVRLTSRRARCTGDGLPANTPFGRVSGSFIPGYQDAAVHARETYGEIGG